MPSVRKNPTRKREKTPKQPPPALSVHDADQVLELFHPVTARWFTTVFENPTPPQIQGWPAIARGDSTLILAPTGTGKTLTAFLWAINRVMFPPGAAPARAAVDTSA